VTPADLRYHFHYELGRVDSQKAMDSLKVEALAEIAAQMAELVLELREIKADMKRADDFIFGGKRDVTSKPQSEESHRPGA